MDQAAQSIQYQSGYQTEINTDPSAADLVLFFVYAPDGPMSQTREEIDKLVGGNLARAAILLSGTEQMSNNPELLQMVEGELRELLSGYMGRDAAQRVQVLDLNDPALGDQLHALVEYQTADIAMEVPPTLLPPPEAAIILLGRSEQGSLEEAAQVIASQSGFGTDVNTDTSDAELVLFTVNAPDGPMPQTRREIENLDGKSIPRAAILITHVDQMNDPELLELEALEIRQLLAGYMMDRSQAEQLPLLHDNDPELIYKINDLINSPVVNIVMSNPPTPEPTHTDPPILAPTISLIGMPDVSLDQAAQSIAYQSGYATAVNTNAASADLVFFTIHAPDGPMPKTREEFEKLRGLSIPHAAILFTDVDQMNDPELLALVEMEVRELLTGYVDYDTAQQLPLLYDNDPDYLNKIQGYLNDAPFIFLNQ
jgi:translation elongation factor EF-Tu-like GTPase